MSAMTVRIIGGALVFFGALWFGLCRGSLFRRREQYLAQIIVFLKLLEVEINFSSAPLADVFRRISERTELCGLLECAAALSGELGIRAAWERAVDEKCLHITNEDKAALKLLGAELGMTDRENQIKNIQHIEELIKKQHAEASDEKKRLCRLYEGGGALVGLLIVALLI